jgi:hypothetical protein
VAYYHCSEVEHPTGRLLSGPATRGAKSRWTDVEPSYRADRVYLFEGDGDPRVLCAPSFTEGPANVYEVAPRGELTLDVNLGSWKAMSCESAIVLSCVHAPRQGPDCGSSPG